MSRVIDKCIYCGEVVPIECGIVFEGSIGDLQKYVEQKIKEASEKCVCRQKTKVKYSAKCGLTFELTERAKSFLAILETDKPTEPGKPRTTPPVGCDLKCLHKKRPHLMITDDLNDVISAWRCRFTRVEDASNE